MRTKVLVCGTTGLSLLGFAIGCGGFFPPLTTTTTTTTPTPSTTADFVYVANAAASTLAAFAVSTNAAGAGTLTAVAGSPFPLGYSPSAMAVTPSNSFVFAGGVDGIYAYSINSSTGALTVQNGGGAEALLVIPPAWLDISPDGQWLFALSEDGLAFDEYQINATSGALSLIASQNYTAAAGATVVPKMIKVSPNGAYVALALGTGGDVVFPFNTTNGMLGTSYQQIPTGAATTSDNGLTVDSGGTYLYVARSGATSGVAVYAFNPNGTLTQVAGSPFASGAGPFAVAIDSTGKYLYAADRTDAQVDGFTIGAGGVLTVISGSPFASGIAVTSLARDNSGKYLLAAASGGSPDLTMYSFDAAVAGKLDTAATATTGTDPTQPIVVAATH